MVFTVAGDSRFTVNGTGKLVVANGANLAVTGDQVVPLTITASDGKGGVASAGINVTILDTPAATTIARNDAATVAEDSSVLVNVLANDAAGATLTGVGAAAGVAGPAHGTVAIVNGEVRYTPSADYSGADSFQYVVRSASGATATARVDVTVTPVNDAPVGVDDAGFRTVAGAPIKISAGSSPGERPRRRWRRADPDRGQRRGEWHRRPRRAGRRRLHPDGRRNRPGELHLRPVRRKGRRRDGHGEPDHRRGRRGRVQPVEPGGDARQSQRLGNQGGRTRRAVPDRASTARSPRSTSTRAPGTMARTPPSSGPRPARCSCPRRSGRRRRRAGRRSISTGRSRSAPARPTSRRIMRPRATTRSTRATSSQPLVNGPLTATAGVYAYGAAGSFPTEHLEGQQLLGRRPARRRPRRPRRAASAATRSPAAPAPTSCSARRATTASSAMTAPTCCAGRPATTSCGEARAPTS